MKAYLRTLTAAVETAVVTHGAGNAAVGSDDLSGAILAVAEMLRWRGHGGGASKVMVVGNGGSAAMASHFAIDLNKRAGVRALALNDAAALTCLANDFGYEHAFAKQVEYLGAPGDMLVAVSSSGRSPSVLNAVVAARAVRGTSVVTFSGFEHDCPLRATGDVNFHVQSAEYGVVELAHMIFLHAIADAMVDQAAPLRRDR
jgi:D-sedoheptulose 7-phosphate isomerase